MASNKVTKVQGIFNVIKYVYQKNGSSNKDKSLISFYDNGNSLPEFVCLIINSDPEIPKASKTETINKIKGKNNEVALRYLFKVKDFPWNPNLLKRQRVYIMLKVLNVAYFKITLQTIFDKSNILFGPLGIKVHKKNQIYTGIYFIRLLHILTDHEVQLVKTFNYSKDIESILAPIFAKYKIPFLLNSNLFNYENQDYILLQIKVVFDSFQDKIKSITGSYENKANEEDKENIKESENLDNSVSDFEKEEEAYFINLVNIIAVDLNLKHKFYDFNEIIEDGFIPSYIIHVFKIKSIKNATLRKNLTIDEQIQNIEATIQFLGKKNHIFKFLNLDFRNPYKRSYSIRRLLRHIFNLYFIKTSINEMFDRYENITDDKKSCRRIGQICSDTLLNLAHFVHTGKRQYKFKPEEYDQYNDVLKFYCMRNKIPAITSLDKLYFYENQPDNNDYFFYQMQIFFNLIDKRPSRRFCEKIFIMQSKLNNVKVPQFSKIASNIKEKQKYQVKTEKLMIENEIEEESDDEQDENKSLLKIIKNPTTFKERYNKDLKIEKSSIEEPQQFWNPSFLANLSHIECGILVDNIEAKPQIEEYSIQKWEEEIKKLISKGERINSSSFVASDSKIQSKLYKLFYYDEKEEKWIFNREQYDMFSKEEHINIEGSNTPVVCYIDSSENDLISLNSNLISHSFPNLNENEIFVYALCGRTLSMLNFEIDYSDKDKSSIKPIFLLLHVPKEKENLPNIKRIVIQIYTFFSLISDLRIVILNKIFFQMQIQTTSTIFNIVDKNINEIVTKQNKESNEETNNKSNSESEYEYEYEEEEESSSYQSDIENSCDDNKTTMIYKKSKMIFLVNDESINHYYYYGNCIDNLELFNRIKNKFDNEIIFSFININDRLTYKSFLDSFNSICLESKSFPSEIINNLNCINIMCNMSSLYISIKESPSSQPSIIDSIIRQRYEKLGNNFDLLNEIENFSLQFDIQFKKESGLVAKKIGKEKCRLFSSELKIELNKSAEERLGNVNYILQNRFYWNRQELEGIQRDHISFLEEEFLNIIKILCGDKDCGFFYEENIEILNQQIESDKLRFQVLFSPYMKLIEIKENPKEEDFLDAKNKGTSYILKEKENVTEVKVAIEMDTDLKSIIKQDF